MTQVEALHNYLQRKQHITRAEAFTELGITNLWQRISELEQTGVKIERVDFCVRSRYGRKVHGIRYWLATPLGISSIGKGDHA